MPTIEDSEFGTVAVRRQVKSSHIRIRVAPDGRLRVSVPPYTPLFMVKRMLNSSRDRIREMLEVQRPNLDYEDGSEIGKSHSLIVRQGASLKSERKGLHIILTLPKSLTLSSPEAQEHLRKQTIAALRREAKGYLPKRLEHLAKLHGFSYERVRFSHSSGRWGSCSSAGTISLNIALMKLPFELIDYVLIHELAHTRQMNHSSDFWQIVEDYDPKYRLHKKQLKNEIPTI